MKPSIKQKKIAKVLKILSYKDIRKEAVFHHSHNLTENRSPFNSRFQIFKLKYKLKTKTQNFFHNLQNRKYQKTIKLFNKLRSVSENKNRPAGIFRICEKHNPVGKIKNWILPFIAIARNGSIVAGNIFRNNRKVYLKKSLGAGDDCGGDCDNLLKKYSGRPGGDGIKLTTKLINTTIVV